MVSVVFLFCLVYFIREKEISLSLIKTILIGTETFYVDVLPWFIAVSNE